MSLSSKLTAAIKGFTGRPDSSDAVSFQLGSRGKVLCLINGVGATGTTPEIALTKALGEWSRIVGKKRRRTSRR